MSYYTIECLDGQGNGHRDPSAGRANLKRLFPDGEANEMNFVLFSTSGVHGSYLTIEDIERQFDSPPHIDDDLGYSDLTALVVQPRLVCLRYGNILVLPEDIPWLKTLRASSKAAIARIGERGR